MDVSGAGIDEEKEGGKAVACIRYLDVDVLEVVVVAVALLEGQVQHGQRRGQVEVEPGVLHRHRHRKREEAR